MGTVERLVIRDPLDLEVRLHLVLEIQNILGGMARRAFQAIQVVVVVARRAHMALEQMPLQRRVGMVTLAMAALARPLHL